MPILKVLLNQKGEVVGTARPDVGGSGADAPQSATLVARPGQRLIEVNVDDTTASLEPAALHAQVKSKHTKAPRKKKR